MLRDMMGGCFTSKNSRNSAIQQSQAQALNFSSLFSLKVGLTGRKKNEEGREVA